MKFGLFYSGGKDSSLALYKTLLRYKDIELLINYPSDEFNIYFQKPTNILKDQIEILKLDYKIVKEDNYIKAIRKLAKGNKYIISGVIYSAFQNRILNEVLYDKIKDIFNPNWLLSIDDFVKFYKLFNIKSFITKVSAFGLSEKDLGKDFLEIYKKNYINPLGEGGEYESFVIDSIFFNKKIKIYDFKIKKCGEFCYYVKDINYKIENKENKTNNIFLNLNNKNNSDFLVVGLHKENYLHFFEFSYPLIKIFNSFNPKYIHLYDFLYEDIKKYKFIVFSGTSLFDFEYKKFINEIVDKIDYFNGKLIGICAGSQILAKYLGLKLKRKKLIGIYDVYINKIKAKSWFLTHYILENSIGEPHLTKEDIVGIKYRNVLLFNYHPEYSIIALKNKFLFEYIYDFLLEPR